MNALFSVDGWIYKGLTRIMDIMIINLCWIIGSLPIVTIGISTVAAFDVSMKIVRKEEGYLFRDFWKSYKQNWKKGLLLGITLLALLYFFYLDYQIYQSLGKPVAVIVVMIIAAVFLSFYLLYAFPLTARYENTILQTLKNSMLFSIRFFLSTLWMIAQVAIIVLACFYNELTLLLGLLLGPGAVIFTMASRSVYVFMRYEELMANYEETKEE